MRFSRFFIDRPIFAAVVSIVIFIAGLIAMFGLPISEYPEVVPPSVVVRAIYPGANPRVISEAVATPLEEQINGVEHMLYMSSQATSDGVLTLTVTFRVGTDVDLAQVQVQNRVSQALPRLPEEVRQLGVTTVKSSPNFIMVVHLVSPDHRYNDVYLRNYGLLQIKDVLARIPGIGQVQVFGGGDYAMRVWLDPGKVAARGLTASDVVNAIREVVKTLFEAILLVVLVVVLFLQTWRASIIPLVAVPISIVGTFAILLGFGFSINTLSLFGLVLAIGIVVDDAIVVVENVERNIEAGLSPHDASVKSMDEVGGALIAIALVLCAVFVPVAFLSGLTGEFYRQFALTIAGATIISLIVSLTLSPALSAILLKSREAAPDRLTRVLDRTLGWIFRPFNRVFRRGSEN